jgi:hypothetical protein
LTTAVIQYAEGQYAEGPSGRRHRSSTPRASYTPRVSTPPPREVYAEAICRRLPSAYEYADGNLLDAEGTKPSAYCCIPVV